MSSIPAVLPTHGEASNAGAASEAHADAFARVPPAGTAPAASTSPAPQNSSDAPAAERERPCIALSQGLMMLYKRINESYFVQKRLEGEQPKFNNGYDDRDGHYIVLAGEEILGRYTVLEVLGKGSFGTVIKCFDEKRQESVALKLTRNGTNFRNQAKLEIDILLKLNGNTSLGDLVVKLYKVFDWKGHLVLVFELLSFNLYQLIRCTQYRGVSLDLVRKFTYQLLVVLDHMQSHSPAIIHCDLKPENILLKNQNRSGIRLIDLGSACYETRCIFKYIQSRYYRSPEVIMNLEYGTAIDRWSLGCVLVELHVGVPLFDGRTEHQQLHKMAAVLGPLPRHMIEGAPKRDRFYREEAGQWDKQWVLSPLTVPPSQPIVPRSLSSIIGVETGGPGGRRDRQLGHDVATYRQFLDLVSRLLTYDPAERISVAEALQHPFLDQVKAATAAPGAGVGGPVGAEGGLAASVPLPALPGDAAGASPAKPVRPVAP